MTRELTEGVVTIMVRELCQAGELGEEGEGSIACVTEALCPGHTIDLTALREDPPRVVIIPQGEAAGDQ